MSKITRKTIVIFLILNLICASINPAIFGLISHAEEGESGEGTNATTAASVKLDSIGVELGIDKTEWSTRVENEVVFTITLDTSTKGYEVYKDKNFEILLPEDVEAINISELEVFYDNDCFECIDTVEENKINITIKAKQESLTENSSENVQIYLRTKIETNKLIPTKQEFITFSCGDKSTTTNVDLKSEKGLIIATEAICSDKSIKSIGENIETLEVNAEAQQVTIKGTVINNTGEKIEDLIIMGTSDINMGEIEQEELDVKYIYDNNNEQENYDSKQETKKYKVENLQIEDKGKIEFSYKINLNKENQDKKYNFQLEVNEIISKVIIKQEVKRSLKGENSLINANMSLKNISIIEEDKKNQATAFMDISLKGQEQADEQVRVFFTGFNKENIEIEDIYILNNTGNIEKQNIETGKNDVQYCDVLVEKNKTKKMAISLKIPEESLDEEIKMKIDVMSGYNEDEIINLEATTNLLKTAKFSNENIMETEISLENPDIKIDEMETLKFKLEKNENIEINEILINFPEGITAENLEAGKLEFIEGQKEYSINIKATDKASKSNKIQTVIKYTENGIKYQVLLEIKLQCINSKEIYLSSDNMEYEIIVTNNSKEEQKVELIINEKGNKDIYSIAMYNVPFNTNIKGNLEKNLIAPSLDGKIDRIKIPYSNALGILEVNKKIIEIKAKPQENQEINNQISIQVTGNVTVSGFNNTKIVEPLEQSYSRSNVISGSAWIDENGNGAIDNSETLLKDVQAVLVNSATAEIVGTARTDNNGQYEFTEIEEGNYVVNFNYNAKTFKTTSYKNEAAAEEANSDAITTVQNNTATTKTDVIQVINGTTENANIGLVLNKTFDLAINSGINKVTVDNEQGSNTYDFNNINLAKVEIEGEYFKDSLVLVEYEVAVTNLGDTEGYATKISNKVPEEMEFIAELNPDWYEGEDGNLYSSTLANEKLAQGETKTIKLVLAREMTEGTIQSPVNNVQIEETFNDYLIKDSKKENDKSESTIIISLTTGIIQKYIWLAVLVIAIITVGLFGTRKIVKIDIKNLTKQGKE